MKKLFYISFILLACTSCGIKDEPEYKSQINNNKAIYLA